MTICNLRFSNNNNNPHLFLGGVGAAPNLLDKVVEASRLVGTLYVPESLRQHLLHAHCALLGLSSLTLTPLSPPSLLFSPKVKD